ncbi:RNA-directed DNA polymerase, eukaryota [Tanacetum coccineum]|uniref:RNA-directed DNA polymerase, eukaryota n=1 Tax=Tanacetum coccineum TaxID=301880 RepID=A0ABQ5H2X7_9ASTR
MDFSFRRKPRDGVEQEQYVALLDQVKNITLGPLFDRRIWSLENSGEFSVASVRKMIDDKMLSDVAIKTRWIKSIPIKVNVHAWKVRIDSLPTRLNISRRGMDIDSIMCPICDNGVESSSHLFFSCHMVREIIRKITRWWDVTYMEMYSYEDWLSWLVNLRLSSKHKQVLEGVFYVMWRHLWSYRNKKIFDSKSPSWAMIFEDVVSRSYHWCRFRCKASFSWNDWLKSPYLVSLVSDSKKVELNENMETEGLGCNLEEEMETQNSCEDCQNVKEASSSNEFLIFDDELVMEGSKKWEMSACGYFVGYRMYMQELNYHLYRMWKKFGLKHTLNNGNAIFVFKFNNSQGLQIVIESGP